MTVFSDEPATIPFSRDLARPNNCSYYQLAVEACDLGDDIRCAVYLREAVRRWLIAHCDADGIPIASERARAEEMINAIRQTGFDVCTWVDEILESCEAVARLVSTNVSMATCLSVARAVFCDEIESEGGEL